MPSLTPFVHLMRLHQPTGIWLLMFPCWWGIALASEKWPDGRLLALFAAGAVIMRGAGCIVNDLADRDIDARVARTRTRPLASGAVSVRGALALLAGLLAAGLCILLTLPPASVMIGLATVPLIIAYPFMKRLTWWPQAFLGLTFNLGVLVGWAAVRGTVEWPAVWLYLGCMAWTFGYDTLYALQDRRDDARIGVKSSALRLGDTVKPAVRWTYTAATACWSIACIMGGIQAAYAIILGLFLLLILFFQVAAVHPERPVSAMRAFKSNTLVGIVIFGAILLGKLYTPAL